MDYENFEVRWEKWVTSDEQSYVLGILRKYLPTLSKCQELISNANKEQIRISITVEYPYDLEPDAGRLAFGLYHSDSNYQGASIGFHLTVYKDQGDTTIPGPPIGSVRLHDDNWPRFR
ncbi:MAG: hypothetical protein ABSF09_14320 [Candidatus Bathyarchaeia archaeon]|jgi:hypothetical protein